MVHGRPTTPHLELTLFSKMSCSDTSILSHACWVILNSVPYHVRSGEGGGRTEGEGREEGGRERDSSTLPLSL